MFKEQEIFASNRNQAALSAMKKATVSHIEHNRGDKAEASALNDAALMAGERHEKVCFPRFWM